MNIFVDIGIMILIAALVAFLVRILKQPQILAYIVTGVLLSSFGVITNKELITNMSEIGIAFLLFIVGLEIDFKKLKDIGAISVFGGLIQFLLTFSIGFALANVLGFEKISAVYVGLVLSFSSTLIVIKMLSDKRQIDTLHGKVIIGFLIMQDLLAVITISLLTALNGEIVVSKIGYTFFLGIGLFVLAMVLSKYVFGKVAGFAATSQDLLFIFELGVCFLFSILYHMIGYSIAIGAFVAGISLANLPYNVEMIGKMKSLRDFFVIIFFISLGMQMVFTLDKAIIAPLIALVLFVIIIKPLLIMVICGFFSYSKRTSFQASISLAQISEFSLIIVAQGLVLGQISNSILSITIFLAIITMTLTSYLMNYEPNIYKKISKYLKIFEVGTVTKLEYFPEKEDPEVIFCGYDRIGYSIVNKLIKLKKKYLIIDYNPDMIKNLIKRKIPCLYGDISDQEILERLNLDKCKQIISTIPEKQIGLFLLKKIKQNHPHMIVFLTANTVEDALDLYKNGADYVILPHFLGGEHVSALIEGFKEDSKKILEYKFSHMMELEKRKKMGHKHPKEHK